MRTVRHRSRLKVWMPSMKCSRSGRTGLWATWSCERHPGPWCSLGLAGVCRSLATQLYDSYPSSYSTVNGWIPDKESLKLSWAIVSFSAVVILAAMRLRTGSYQLLHFSFYFFFFCKKCSFLLLMNEKLNFLFQEGKNTSITFINVLLV